MLYEVITNPRFHLKPGMFARVEVVLQRIESAVIVPEQALAGRDGQSGLFVVDASYNFV